MNVSKYITTIRVRLDSDLLAALRGAAKAKECDMSDLVRDLLRQGLEIDAALEAREAVRRVVRQEVDRAADRLAKMIFKAGFTAMTMEEMMYIFLKTSTDTNPDEAKKSGQKKAAIKMSSRFKVEDLLPAKVEDLLPAGAEEEEEDDAP